MVSDRRTFGERLKRHRERRGISLKAISESTKISTSLFVSLENGDCSRWPTGLYSRAYVRAYAEAVGLNVDETVEDFAALFSGKVAADGLDAAPPRRRRETGALRLSLAEDPPLALHLIGRRATFALGELVVASVLALLTYTLLDAGVWLTVAATLLYHAVGRVVSDEPLVWWLYCRAKTALAPAVPVDMPAEHGAPPEDVPVGNAASTAA